MNVKVFAALAAGLLSAAPAMASNVTIDFEGVTTDAPVGDLYNNLGVSFGLDAIGFANSLNDTFYSNAPSPLGVMSPVNAAPSASMNAIGTNTFVGTIAFFYSSLSGGTVTVHSGVNGTGTLLGTINLGANAQDGCNDTLFCHWDQVSLDFAGQARSILFSDAVGSGFDNITVNAVPLPAAVWLLMSALGGFGTIVSRKRVG